MNIAKTSALVIFTLGVLSACSSAPTSTPSSSSAANTTASTASTSASSQSVSGNTITTSLLPAYLDPKNAISSNRSIYFDFDDYAIKKQYESMLELHGKYLSANPSVAIKIEGSTDERGGAEYNLALGQKRAEAARRALLVYGVKASQMEAISWGKEKPMANGHDESSWAKNRRADLDYPKK